MAALVYVVMGVSGCGKFRYQRRGQGQSNKHDGVLMTIKTTIGKILAIQLQCEFIDADDYHTSSSVEKMSNGIPLNDQDRKEWLERLQSIIQRRIAENRRMVLACSALKKAYRLTLRGNFSEHLVRFIYLKGTFEIINERLKERKGHYMPESLLQSQFDILEEPDKEKENCFIVNIEEKPENIVSKVINI